jgi:hypothetical protein
METYIKITPDTLIEMCDKEISFLERLEEEAIEIHIANNIKPERKKLFSTNKAVTREDVIAQLDSEIDKYEFRGMTFRDFVCYHLRDEINKTKSLKSMAQTSSNSPDNLIRLSRKDHSFLLHLHS